MKLTFRLIALIILFFMSCIQYTPAQSWSKLGGGSLAAKDGIGSVCRDAAGNIYAGGSFTNGINSAAGKHYVAKWDITTNTWSELGGLNALSANNFILSVNADLIGNIYAAGRFTNSNGERYVAKWDKTTNTWSELGGLNSLAANSDILSVCSDAAGNIYAAGYFTNSSGKRYVAKWDITTNTWSELGGLNSLAANNDILSVCSDTAGNIYAAGSFTDSIVSNNLSGVYYVAKYSGTLYVRTICPGDSFLFFNHYYSVAGNYYDTLINYLGGDSVITLHLTVKQTAFASDTAVLCYLHTYNFYGQMLSQSGNYVDTLKSYLGCDSLIHTLHLTILPANTDTLKASICYGQSYLFGHDTLYQSGFYYDTLSGAALGCDSIIVLQLTILPKLIDTIQQQFCKGNTYIFNHDTLSQAGLYTDTLTSYRGCDSIIVLQLQIHSADTVHLQQQICYGGSYLFNQHVLLVSGVYSAVLTNQYGCDSLLLLNLTVLPAIDTSLSFTNDTLFSNATACTYQWFNCDSNKINVGATNSSFKPTLAGHYAVILTSTNNANCVDTSNCRMVRLNTGISSFTINNSQLTIYPNPCGNKLSISGMQLSGNTKIEVLDVLGQVVFNKSINNSTNQPIQLDVSNFTSQIYLLKVTDATGEQYFAKFVKQ